MNHLGTVMLESDRLILRRIYESDAVEIYNGFVNQKDFLYYANKSKRTLQEEINSLKGINEKYKQKDYYNWVITLKDTKEIIGSINANLFGFIVDNINYAIDERFTNNGYMSEALSVILKFFFEKVGVKEIYCGCCIENKASKKVMLNNKMKLVEIKKAYINLSDGYHDMYLFSLKKGEYMMEDNKELLEEDF